MIITAFVIIIFLLIYFITVPSLRVIDDNITKRMELNRLYQQWLITEYSTYIYLTSDKNKIVKQKISENLELFENGLSIFISDSSFTEIRDKYSEISNESINIIEEWQYTRNYILKILNTENSYKLFEKQIYWLANDTVMFDKKLKNMINWLESYNKKQFVFYWNMFYSLSSITVVIFVFFIIYIRKFIKSRISEKKVRDLLDSVVKVREKERHSIALEIHDTIIQDMVFSKMLCMEILNSRDKSSAENELAELTDRIVNSIQQIRDISANLRPPEFEKEIIEILTDYIENFVLKTGIKVDYLFSGIERIKFDNPLKLGIYRIIQESLKNIIKHSKADNVRIRMLVSFPFVFLKIEDDGIGLEKDKAFQKSDGRAHSGLKGILERVRMFDGEIKIKSSPGKGVLLDIRIPIKENIYAR